MQPAAVEQSKREATHTHLHLLPRFRMTGAVPPLATCRHFMCTCTVHTALCTV